MNATIKQVDYNQMTASRQPAVIIRPNKVDSEVKMNAILCIQININK